MFQKTLSIFLLLVTMSFASHARELVVWSAGAVKPALEELVPAFEKQAGVALKVDYAPVGVWMRRLADGGQPDVLILSADVVNEVERKGWAVAGSAKPLGSVGVGVAMALDRRRAAAPRFQEVREQLLQAGLVGDRPRRRRVVSGDHHHMNTRSLTVLDSSHHAFT